MRFLAIKIFWISLAFGICFFISPNTSYSQNSINGMIFDHNRRPVPNIEVELLDDLERLIGSRKTRGSGFYSFSRLNAGIYYIKVRVGGTNFKEPKIRIDLGALNSIGGVDVKQVDLHLELIDRKERNSLVSGVVFVQEIPSTAAEFYRLASKMLEKKDFKAAQVNLMEAIAVFPDYYDALLQLGHVYLIENLNQNAENMFSKVVEINPKSFSGYFGIAIAARGFGDFEKAESMMKKAIQIDGQSDRAYFLLGTIQRDLKKHVEAETNLLKVKELTDNKSADANWQLALLYYYNLKKHDAAANELTNYLRNLSKDDKKKNPEKVKTVNALIKQIEASATNGY